MPTYIYECIAKHGEFEYSHSIKDNLEFCPHCKEEHISETQPVKRLIANTSFVLLGGGWASTGYK